MFLEWKKLRKKEAVEFLRSKCFVAAKKIEKLAVSRLRAGLGPARAVTAGGLHSCGIELDGRAKCWGKGEDS